MKKRLISLFAVFAMVLSLFAVTPMPAAADGEDQGPSDHYAFGTGEDHYKDFAALVTAVNTALQQRNYVKVDLWDNVQLDAPVTFTIPAGTTLEIQGNGRYLGPGRNWNNDETAAMINVTNVQDQTGGVLELRDLIVCCGQVCWKNENDHDQGSLDLNARALHITNVDAKLAGLNIRDAFEGVEAIVFRTTANRSGDPGDWYHLYVENSQIFESAVDNNDGGTVPTAVRVESNNSMLLADFFGDGDENDPYTHISKIVKTEIGNDSHCIMNVMNGRYGFDPTGMTAKNWCVNKREEDDKWWYVDITDEVVAFVNQYAYASLASATDEWWDGCSLSLCKDVTLEEPLVITGKQNIEFNGNDHHIAAAQNFTGEALLVFKDCKNLNFHHVILDANGANRTAVKLYSENNRKLENNWLCLTTFNGFACAIDARNCELNSHSNHYNNCATAVALGNSSNEDVEANINYSWMNGGKLTVREDGGKWFKVNCDNCWGIQVDVPASYNQEKLELNFGRGDYCNDPAAYIDTDIYKIDQKTEPEGIYSVSIKYEAAVAKIWGEPEQLFLDLNDALNSAEDGQTVELLKNVTLNDPIELSGDKRITLQGKETEDGLTRICASDDNFNFRDYDALFLLKNKVKLELHNVFVDARGKAGACFRVRGNNDDNSNNNAALEVGFAFMFGSNGPAVQAEDNAFVRLHGGIYGNIGEGPQHTYMEEFLDSDEFLRFVKNYEKNDNGNLGKNDQGEYFQINDDNYEGDRYFRNYCLTYDDTKPYIKLEGAKFADVGFGYDVTVKVYNGTGVAGMGLRVSYDTDQLEYVSAATPIQENEEQNIPAPSFKAKDNYVQLIWAQPDGIESENANFTLATLHFKVKDGVDERGVRFELEKIPGGDQDAKNISDANGDPMYFNLVALDTNLRYKPGDVTGDGNVAIADVQMLLKYIVGYEYSEIRPTNPDRAAFQENQFRMAADVDQDGQLTVADAVRILRVVANKGNVTLN